MTAGPLATHQTNGRLRKSASTLFGHSHWRAWAGKVPVNPDFKELLREFNAHRVEFLVIGAHALAAYGHVRATKDLDLWIRPVASNAANTIRALRAFGAPLQDLSEQDLTHPGVIFQVGVDPVRIDIMTSIDGVLFDEAWPARFQTHYGDQPVSVLSRQHLIQNKRASGRKQDLADIEILGE